MLVLIVYFISKANKNIRLIGIELLILSAILACTVINELKDDKYKALLFIEVVLLVLLIKYFDNIFIFMLPFIVLEIITSLKNKVILYLLSYVGLFFIKNNYFLITSFTIIIYFENYVIINKYKSYVDEYINEEYKLKQSIDNKDILLKRELEENNIYFENKMLEEKSRIYQSLHDKLGHSINGSLYQLEACKVLIDKEPEKIWDVILDNSIEAVSNALKYSKCSKISINISILNKIIRCSINDNGIGCENIEDGMGVQGMKRRARKINGIVDIEGKCGFNINMIFPLN